jgi:hypothetical protein
MEVMHQMEPGFTSLACFFRARLVGQGHGYVRTQENKAYSYLIEELIPTD